SDGSSFFSAGAASAAGASAFFSAAGASPSSIVHTTAPISKVSPSCAMMRRIPAFSAGNSKVALSDSNSAIFSSISTYSPSCFSHWASVTSVIDSPTAGTFISKLMSLIFKTNVVNSKLFTTRSFYYCLCKCLINNFLLFCNVLLHITCGRTSACATGNEICKFKLCFSEDTAEVRPSSHVFVFFLYPDKLSSFFVFRTYSFQLFYRSRIKLFYTHYRHVFAVFFFLTF